MNRKTKIFRTDFKNPLTVCYPEETAINYKDADMYKDGKKQQHIITSQKKAGVAL